MDALVKTLPRDHAAESTTLDALAITTEREIEFRRAFIAQDVGPRYEVGRLLGQGGFASVWLAEDRATGTPVAIKRFENGRDTAGQSFYRELRAMARLISPRIVRLYNLLETPSHQRYLFVEYCAGGSLRDFLEYLRSIGKRMPIDLATKIIRQLATGLSEAHELGLAHRDLKPENVLFTQAPDLDLETWQPDAKLADFGLAQASAHLQSNGRLLGLSGSPAYMAPEQFSGTSELASDLYSLGVIAYELVHGRLPFFGTAAQLARQHLYAEPNIDEALPHVWQQFLRSLLAKDPAERRGSWEYLDALVESAEQSIRKPSGSSAIRPKSPKPSDCTSIQAPNGRLRSWLGRGAPIQLTVHRDEDRLAVITTEGLTRFGGNSLMPSGQWRQAGLTSVAVGQDGCCWLAQDRRILRWSPGGETAIVEQLDQRIEGLTEHRGHLAAVLSDRLVFFKQGTPGGMSGSAAVRQGGMKPVVAWHRDGVCLVAEGPVAPRVVEVFPDGCRGREILLPGPCWKLVAGYQSASVYAIVLVNTEFELFQIDLTQGRAESIALPAAPRLLALDPTESNDVLIVDAFDRLLAWRKAEGVVHAMPLPHDFGRAQALASVSDGMVILGRSGGGHSRCQFVERADFLSRGQAIR